MAKFPNTQWSLIRQSGITSSGRAAFGELVRLYRAAIFAFFRARLDAASADDATQSFLAASYEHDWWSRADVDIGSFRSFLLMLLRRHLGHLRQLRQPAGHDAIAVDDVADESPAADRQFDARFALTLTTRAIDAQRTRYAQRERGALFEQLLPLLMSPPEHGELKPIAESLRMQANSLTVELQRLRRRLRDEMRGLVMELCADEANFAVEWAALQQVLGGG